MRLRAIILPLAPLLLGAMVFVACGGEDQSQQVKYPSKTGQEDAGAGAPVSNGNGAQVGVTEGPQEHAAMSSDAKGSYDEGFKAWISGDLQTAKADFKKATEADPKAAAAFYSLGTVLERLGDNSGAQQAYKQSFAAKSDYELGMGAYALNLAHTGHLAEADTFLTEKHQKMPKSARITNYLAEVKSLEKDSATAQQLAQDALRIDSNFHDAMVTIARDHYRAGRIDLASYALKAILEGFGQASPARDPGNAEALLLRGLIERDAGQRIPAMKDFEAAHAKRPDMVEATVQVAAMKLEAGNATEAQPLLESAIRYAPQSALAHMNLGDCYRLQRRWADAKKELDKALSLDSSLMQPHYDLGLMYLFAPSFPGMSASDQIGAAIRELNTYKKMRGPKAPPGVSDDIDDLIARATQKQTEMQQAKAAAAAAASSKPAAGTKK